ncbi:thioredoxin domain-containing protein [Streptomyces sp. NPDC001941]|uniref:thioredoxin domain-containing protein n=1 Tax=Streptomyces sp. NPDC001941 TaxID=3154659 RepID=UPI00332324C4
MTAHRSARQRMHAEREKQARAARRRRHLVVGGVLAGVLVAGGAVALTVSAEDGDTSSSAAAADGPLVTPKNTTESGGSVVVYGNPSAKRTLDVYEDPRCPFCGIVERGLGSTMQKLADEGKVKVRYHVATFLDDATGGGGSKNALAAMGAALDQGPKQFAAVHAALYEHQPEESSDTFADTSELLKLTAGVPGLDQAAFKKAVQDGTYLPWAKKAGKDNGRHLDDAWAKAKLPGRPGTPAVFLDGERLNVVASPQSAISPADFTKLVTK